MHPELPDPHTIVVQVMPGGKLMINQEQSDWSTLGTRLSDIFKERADKLAFVVGAKDLSFSAVAHAIDIMRGVYGAITSHRPNTGKIFA